MDTTIPGAARRSRSPARYRSRTVLQAERDSAPRSRRPWRKNCRRHRERRQLHPHRRGGVDGAIHRAGGPQILEECRAIVGRQGGCPAGQAVVSTGGGLRARHVIHAVGPVWHGGGRGEDAALKSADVKSLERALSVRARSVSFPCISTGAYGFPAERAAHIATDDFIDFLREHERLDEARFVVFGPEDHDVYARLFEAA